MELVSSSTKFKLFYQENLSVQTSPLNFDQYRITVSLLIAYKEGQQ